VFVQLLINFEGSNQLIDGLATNIKAFQCSPSHPLICGCFPGCGKESLSHLLRLVPKLSRIFLTYIKNVPTAIFGNY
jgi:hypothetical protein